MAKLHKQAAVYDPPPGFTRRSWDLAGLTGENLDVPLEQAEDALTPAQLDVLADTSRKVEEVMQSLGSGPEVFGLIHADLHEKNYIFTPYGTVGAIDFDTCGWGYYVYDLAVTLSTLLQRRDLAELKNALVRGYRQVRQLSTTHENLIIPFVAGRLLINTLWVAGHSNDRDLREAAPKVIERQIKFLEKFLGR
ncbi:MAG: phosphotransferase, partial [Anaerolineales bacterium]|nr:phosphotransferase [Anaerolineales bacterium]